MPVITIIEPARNEMPAREMNIGQVGIATDGEVLLRCYDFVVSLTNPRTTWSKGCGVFVTPVPSGSTITFVTP